MFSHVLMPKNAFCVSSKFRKYISDSTHKSLEKYKNHLTLSNNYENLLISEGQVSTGVKCCDNSPYPPIYSPYFSIFFSISALIYYFCHKK
jgi:hypothetical protein